MHRRLVIIGLDGATFDIIRPLERAGRLPFLSEIIRNGVHGQLRSTCPPVTAPAWTSFMTGKNPGKHGLFDFQRMDDSGARTLTYSTDCRSATIWEYLSEAGMTLLLVNIPMTYPPRPLNGICIAGFPIPHHANYVYPREKLQWVRGSGYLTDWTEVLARARWRSKIRAMEEVERARIDVFGELMRSEPWDIAMLVISGTDHVAHLEWQKGNRRAVEAFYVYVDGLLGDLGAEGAFETATVVIMSDHGFTQSEYVFYMNVWLMTEGYLSFSTALNRTYDRFADERQRSVYGAHGKLSQLLGWAGLTRDRLVVLAKTTGLIRLERYLPHGLISVFPRRDLVPDWARTRVYMASNLSKGLNINLKGRDKYGTVSKGEYTALRMQVVEKLRSLRLSDGTDLFEFVDIKENVYQGPFLDQAPDIVAWPGSGCNVKIGQGRGHYLEKVVEAHHTMDGIFMSRGEDIRRGVRVDLDMTDVAPTLIHYLGLPCPDDVDGRVVKEIFRSGSEPASREVAFREPLRVDHDGGPGSEEEESIKTKLRALGYL